MAGETLGFSRQFIDLVSSKEYIIWDWNGTLLNDVDHAIKTMNHLLASHKLSLLDKSRYQKIFEFPIIKYYSNLGFDFEKESFEGLCHRFVDQFMAEAHSLPLFEGARSTLQQLQALGKKQSILSATDQLNLNAMINHFELNDIFVHVFGIQNKFASSKIERGHELILTANCALEDIVMIGDTLHDLEVGNALGIDVVLVSHGHQCASKLRNNHHLVWSSLPLIELNGPIRNYLDVSDF